MIFAFTPMKFQKRLSKEKSLKKFSLFAKITLVFFLADRSTVNSHILYKWRNMSAKPFHTFASPEVECWEPFVCCLSGSVPVVYLSLKKYFAV
jgi:hypothetical protein